MINMTYVAGVFAVLDALAIVAVVILQRRDQRLVSATVDSGLGVLSAESEPSFVGSHRKTD